MQDEYPDPPNRTVQQAEKAPRWPSYVMFCGLLCILASAVFQIVVQLDGIFDTIPTVLGYTGVLLVFIGFSIHVSLE